MAILFTICEFREAIGTFDVGFEGGVGAFGGGEEGGFPEVGEGGACVFGGGGGRTVFGVAGLEDIAEVEVGFEADEESEPAFFPRRSRTWLRIFDVSGVTGVTGECAVGFSAVGGDG